MIGLFGESLGVRIAFGGAFFFALLALLLQQRLIDEARALVKQL